MTVRRMINGDMTFGAGAMDFLSGVDEIAQIIGTRLRLFTGEWFLDTAAGTEWQDAVLGKGTVDSAEIVIRDAILQCPGVTEITEFDILQDAVTRAIRVTVEVNTVSGSVSTGVVIDGNI